MVKFFIKLDDESADWLASKIDNSKPTVRDVAHAILLEAANAQRTRFVNASQGLPVVEARVCKCGMLEAASAEENSSIVLDEITNEYNLVRTTPHGKEERIIRYCLWCGGRAPATSRRKQLFAKIEREEIERLNKLCDGVRTFEDAISRFGTPDFDHNEGWVIIGKTEEGADEHTPHRVISYETLSETANVRFTQKVGDLVSVSFIGKYIGPARDLERKQSV